MMEVQIMVAAVATGVCTKFFGWPGFWGSVVGNIAFLMYIN